jgi:predicted RNA polymerase sigma factor
VTEAVADANGAAAGLAALAGIPPSTRWHAVRADLLAREGRFAEAVDPVAAALRGEVADAERRYRERRRAAWSANVK